MSRDVSRQIIKAGEKLWTEVLTQETSKCVSNCRRTRAWIRAGIRQEMLITVVKISCFIQARFRVDFLQADIDEG